MKLPRSVLVDGNKHSYSRRSGSYQRRGACASASKPGGSSWGRGRIQVVVDAEREKRYREGDE
ncbi:hypothetical protein PspLS_06032 [Pyricularia sp. CBS 133598]|nr:hypothetical protein PspLS_06032 [Pyricularia sp. CBS 133598]